MKTVRRAFMARSAALAAGTLALSSAHSAADAQALGFNPQPGAWRTFKVHTRIQVMQAQGVTQLWLPLTSVQSSWQQTQRVEWKSNGLVRALQDPAQGIKIASATFDATQRVPVLEVIETVQVKSRAVVWNRPTGEQLTADERAHWTRATQWLPTDGIVRDTARRAVGGASTDIAKARAIYDWVIQNAFRDQSVKGCGSGDIKGMLESGYLGGKCADLNALFVGLCRAAGVPARDVYGLRLAPSAFGYKQLGGKSSSLSGAQHCRAEVFLSRYGWVAMDPADVTKVMRAETGDWVRDTHHPVIAPVARALFGQWEGNWMAYNTAHDVVLPGSDGRSQPFVMYPMGTTGGQPLNHYSPSEFSYNIQAEEA